MRRSLSFLPVLVLSLSVYVHPAFAWFDDTHVMIGKAAGYSKWYNGAGADMLKVKASSVEGDNHYVNNPEGTVVTPQMVLEQVSRYDQPDAGGHLYGAIIASLRNFKNARSKGKYGEYHLAFCLHYSGDLSQPLHNIVFGDFNKKNHLAFDEIVKGEVLENYGRIRIYPIGISSEGELAREVARIANLSLRLGEKLQKENRLLSKEEAYEQLSHSASLFKAILDYVDIPN